MSEDGMLQIPTNKILIKVKPQYHLESILKNLRIEYEVCERLGHDKYAYLITLNDGESLTIANKLYESGYFDYAQPSFTRFKGLMNEFYNNQWGLRNIGQYGGTNGIDIKAVQAWNITTGISNIKVAVVDQGVDLAHPDLIGHLLPGYDATDGAYGGTNGNCLSHDAHGAACAGIIGAIDNAIGIRGIASNCGIIPVRVSYGIYYGSSYYEIWDDDWTVDAVNHAWETMDADVISCSWGGGYNIPALNNEIHDAVTQGRNGKGSVVVFAAGNNNTTVSYPAVGLMLLL